jgi:hypothetical protein
LVENVRPLMVKPLPVIGIPVVPVAAIGSVSKAFLE